MLIKFGFSVLIGVDYTLNYKAGNADNNSTDHFVVIIGSDCDKKGFSYMFYEVATTSKTKGESDSNRLYLDVLIYSLKGSPEHNKKRNYTITQVRKNSPL